MSDEKARQCFNCFLYYHTSTASSVTHQELYCSAECELEDELRLKSGNALIAQAEIENPLLFAVLPQGVSKEKKIEQSITQQGIQSEHLQDVNSLLKLLNLGENK